MAAVAAGTLVAGPAQAASGNDAGVVSDGGSVSADVRKTMSVKNLSSDDAVRAYWTPARMRAATPLDAAGKGKPQTAAAATTAAKGKPFEVAPSAPAGSTASLQAKAKPVASKTIGKTFFTTADGHDWECAAATINSSSKRLVITAGACLHWAGAWVKNWVFVPRYWDGKAPYGIWTAKTKISFNGWIKKGNRRYDLGIVITKDLKKKRIVKALGGNGVRINQPAQLSRTIIGYGIDPLTPRQKFCEGIGSGTLTMRCDRGLYGPWLLDYNTQGLGYVNGFTSLWHPLYKLVSSVPFDEKVRSLYNDANSKAA